jgi:hypothetical protein
VTDDNNKKKEATVTEVHARISAMMASRVARYASAKGQPESVQLSSVQ